MSTLSLKEAANYIVSGFQTIGTTVTATFQQLQSTLDSILPKLNKEEQQDVITAVSQYTKVLMTTQEFVSFTLVGVKYAETREHLCKAVPTETLSKLISEVESLLNTFLQLQFVIQRKMEEECRLPAFRNIFLGMCALGAGVALICTGFGMVFGSVAVVQGIAVLGLTTAVIGTGGAAMIQAAMKVSDFRQALSSLKKIRACLLEIAAEQSSLKGKHANLCTPGDRSAEGEKVIIDDARQELTDILNKTQTQVTEGFKILKKF